MEEVETNDIEEHIRFEDHEQTSTEFLTEIPPVSPDFPAIPTFIHLSLTIVCTIFYSFLFILIYIQLLLILLYKHKRFSYQSVFLFLCLIWAALRTTLFSFYFKNPVFANNLSALPFWFLYCCPAVLQFITLALLVLYFSQVLFNAKTKYEPTYKNELLRLAIVLGVILFVATNIICAIIIRQQESYNRKPYEVITVRVFINELLFLICGVSLGICVYKLTKITSNKMFLETKGTTICQTLTMCAVIVFLYVTRAAYNIVVVILAGSVAAPSFNFGWINVTDQSLEKHISYVTFGIVLFVWEFLPTFIVVIFFRVKRPVTQAVIPELPTHSITSQSYFFDNPRRYDSDDELFKNVITSHDLLGRKSAAYNVIRTNRYSTPYGSFHSSSYIFRQASLGRSNAIGSVTLAGSHRDRSYLSVRPCSPLISGLHPATVINFHKQHYGGHC